MIPLLVGLGVEELSVAPSSVGAVAALVSRLQHADCDALAQAAIAATTVAQVREAVRRFGTV